MTAKKTIRVSCLRDEVDRLTHQRTALETSAEEPGLPQHFKARFGKAAQICTSKINMLNRLIREG